MKSFGLIIEPPAQEDYRFGALEQKFGSSILKPDADWRPLVDETVITHQAPGYETNSCVPTAIMNSYELLWRLQEDKPFDFSDRYLAKVGGVDPARGSTPRQIVEAFRKQHSVFETEWPTKDAHSTAEFYADPPSKLATLAAGRGAEWAKGWEWVGSSAIQRREALKRSPISRSVYAWEKNQKGEYYRPPGAVDNHCVCELYVFPDGRSVILDSYEPYIKILAADHLPAMAMGHFFQRQVMNEWGWASFLAWLNKVIWSGS